MGNTYPNRGGWFSDMQNSTGWLCLSNVPKYLVAASFLLSAGTGAFTDDLSRLRQDRANEPILSNPLKVYTSQIAFVRTPTEDLERIREILSPAMSDLAKSLNVSRQTIYNWLSGEQPTPEHTARLRDLALAADTFAEAGISVNGILLKRKVIDGKNLLEIISDGGSARDTVQLLIQILRREDSQRERLATRFAGRTPSQSSADSDLTAANDEV